MEVLNVEEKKSYERKSESHSISWVSRRPRYDKTTQLPRTQEKRREGGFLCLGMNERGVYIVVVEEIWIEDHLMRVDKESWI